MGSAALRPETLALYRRHVNRGLARLAGMAALPVETWSSGSLVYDDADRPYLDCGGFGVFLVGHCHPTIVEAACEQLRRHPLSTRTMLNAELARGAEALARVAPEGLDYVFFANSGAEAVEGGLKLARLAGKRRLLSMWGGFHGKTLGALSVTGRSFFQDPFRPLLPDVEMLPYGDLGALERSLSGDACVILEPVQAEGGVVIPPPGYLAGVEQLCREQGAMLILDEVQTGLGRLGTWWGADREGIVPDVLLVGKGLSGGVVPVSAVVATESAFVELNRDPFLHTSTFGGSPLACVVARAAVEVIEREGLVERAAEAGERIMASIVPILERAGKDVVADVRGVGLLIGIEFADEALTGEFLFEMLERRVLVSNSLNSNRVLRLTPPAVISESELEWLVSAVQESAEAVAGRINQVTAGG
jgi:putrescine aminotransferase